MYLLSVRACALLLAHQNETMGKTCKLCLSKMNDRAICILSGREFKAQQAFVILINNGSAAFCQVFSC